VKLRHLANRHIEGAKRQYMPYIIEWRCPTCGVDCSRDLSDYYLSHPVMGEPTNEVLYCKRCDTGVVCTIQISLELLGTIKMVEEEDDG